MRLVSRNGPFNASSLVALFILLGVSTGASAQLLDVIGVHREPAATIVRLSPEPMGHMWPN